MQKFSTGVGPAKVSAGIPAQAAVQFSIQNPGAPLPASMKPGISPGNWTPPEFMNLYNGILNAELSNTRA